MAAASTSQEAELIPLLAASRFIEMYYDVLDRKRDKVAFVFEIIDPTNDPLQISRQTPQVLWNGTPYVGQDSIAQFFNEAMPETQHRKSTVDAHWKPDNEAEVIAKTTGRNPTDDEENFGTGTAFVLITGTLTVGGLDHAYSESLCLRRENNKFRVASSQVRYLD